MAKLYDLAMMNTSTTGTGTMTLTTAVSPYLTFANAGVQNGDVLFYGIVDGSNSEVGVGTYSTTGPTLTRGAYKSTNSNAALNLSGAAQVYLTVVTGDGGDVLPCMPNPLRGFDTPINLQLNASVASNLLTVTITGNNGSTPSNTNPVLVPFRDATVANGDPAWIAITSALSINTNAVGASLGSASSNVPFRFWVVLFNNGGTPVLGLVNCTSTGQIFALDETSVKSTTPMSASATSAGTFYTPNGTTLTNCSVRIIGYVEYSSGLTTAGTYASAPSKVQLFGPGVKRPGDLVQLAAMSTTTSTNGTTAGTVTATACTKSITLASAANSVEIAFAGGVSASTDTSCFIGLYRGAGVTVPVGPGMVYSISSLASGCNFPSAGSWLDTPFSGATTSSAYTVGIMPFSGGGVTCTFNSAMAGTGATAQATMVLKEIMG